MGLLSQLIYQLTYHSYLSCLHCQTEGKGNKRRSPLGRVSNDRRPGRLVDHESVVDFEILVGRLLNDGQQGGPAGFGTGNGTLTEKNYDLLS